jgi:formate dehydrogenase subunit delta
MNPDRLVTMANDIAAFFAAEPDRSTAIAAVANHLTKFWDPRMRREIIAHRRAGGHGLSELAGAAVERLGGQSDPAAPLSPRQIR